MRRRRRFHPVTRNFDRCSHTDERPRQSTSVEQATKSVCVSCGRPGRRSAPHDASGNAGSAPADVLFSSARRRHRRKARLASLRLLVAAACPSRARKSHRVQSADSTSVDLTESMRLAKSAMRIVSSCRPRHRAREVLREDRMSSARAQLERALRTLQQRPSVTRGRGLTP